VVLGNKIGTDVHGTANLGNLDGVFIQNGATANTVGGTATGAANVLSANTWGLVLTGSGTSGNVVLGNKIGTDVNGTAPLGNGKDGVEILGGATANTVGGTATGSANVLSANGLNGVYLASIGTSGNVVLGNKIGTDVHGTAKLGNGNDGVLIQGGAAANTLGGTVTGAANVISDNGSPPHKYSAGFGDGVAISGSGTSGNVVLGNKIGTDINGTAALGNIIDGVAIESGATANTVGGTATGATNVISANGGSGVYISGSGTSSNVVLGNKIGTDVNGTARLGNAANGVLIQFGATANTVGGTATGAANLISANGRDGVVLSGSNGYYTAGTSGNVVLGNKIGTDVNGTANLGNSRGGLVIDNGATANTVGGSATGAANLISGNGNSAYQGDGIDLEGGSGNVVLGNKIGTDQSGTAPLGNNGDGVLIAFGATANTVGGTATGSANVISGNKYGVYFLGRGGLLSGPETSGNVVLGNKIGTDVNGTAKLGNSLDGVVIADGATANTVGGTATGSANLISGNGSDGVYLGHGLFSSSSNVTSGNVVLGNLIGTDKSGTASLGNTTDGVVIASGATANTVGGTATGSANLISANANGVVLQQSGTSGNVVLGNFIGTDVNGTAKLGNTQDGVLIASGATANTVGGSATGAANLISANGGNGVELSGTGTSRNLIADNRIGTDAGGAPTLGNGHDGVLIWQGASANTVSSAAANFIAGNAANAIEINGAVLNINGGGGSNTLTLDAQGQPVGTIPGALTLNATLQQVNYVGITGLNLNNASAVDTFYGPDTADRGTALPGLTPQERFVQVLFLDALGRYGSKSELDAWVHVLTSPGGSQAVVAGDIERSAEARDHLVKTWYLNYLGRAATGGEEQGWVNALLSGQTEEQVLSQFFSTQEFYNRAPIITGDGGLPSNQEYVKALYRVVFNRVPSAGELNAWVNALPSVGRGRMAFDFLTSLEGRTDIVEGIFNALLHRPSDGPGGSSWVESGLDLTSIRVGLESTLEFFNNG
jgi:hypothetical protein